ncbi:MAG: hypothetical protein WC342_05895 [Methanoregula sp.]|jgi:hypothetical protein
MLLVYVIDEGELTGMITSVETHEDSFVAGDEPKLFKQPVMQQNVTITAAQVNNNVTR